MGLFVILKYTLKEYLKGKILINTVFLGAALLMISYVASEFTYAVASRVALDFGLGTISLSIAFISIFLGSTLVSKEIETRTLYMVLSRPISRVTFLIGRVLGLSMVLLLNTLILSVLSLSIYIFLNGEVSLVLLQAIGLIFVEGLLLLSVVILLSLFSNKILCVLMSLTLYIVGHAIEPAKKLSFVENNDLLTSFFNNYSYILPNFSRLNIKNFALYEYSLSPHYVSISFLYGLSFFVIILSISSFIFKKKDLV